MFHTLMTIGYLVPNIYLFLRIKNLFIGKEYRLVYTIVYLLVALIYPATIILAGEEVGSVASVIDVISGYLLPFYLYVFMLVLFLDIFLLINFALKIFPVGVIRSSPYRKFCLPGIMLLSLIIVIAGIINFNTIRTSEYSITVPAKSSGLKNLKIAFVADFHLNGRIPLSFVGKFANKIHEINPDLMIYGGDMVEGDRGDGNLESFARVLSGISPKYGVFGVLGNHEYYYGGDKGNFFSMAGITMLNDTVDIIDGAFSLAGRKDSHFRGRKSLPQILSLSPDSLPLILVDHRPTEIDFVSKTKTDVQLSGHTHDGQLFPVSLITKSVYRLSWGYRKIGNTHFFVTSGIRLWGPPVRTAGKSEIMIINIAFI